MVVIGKELLPARAAVSTPAMPLREIALSVLFVFAAAVFIVSVFQTTNEVWGAVAAAATGYFVARVSPFNF